MELGFWTVDWRRQPPNPIYSSPALPRMMGYGIGNALPRHPGGRVAAGLKPEANIDELSKNQEQFMVYRLWFPVGAWPGSGLEP